MDPLSEILSLLKLKTYICGAFKVAAGRGFDFDEHKGMKCYAVISGQCWLSVKGVPSPILIRAGDCVVLPGGQPFFLAANLDDPRVSFHPGLADRNPNELSSNDVQQLESVILGGHFLLAGGYSDVLLNALPLIVHLRKEVAQKVMRSSLEALREELFHPQPGGSLIAQQLASIVLVQALRLHMEEAAAGVGWLFALSDPLLRTAIVCIHEEPGKSWTLQALAFRVGMSRTVFAKTFKSKVGMTSMEYLTQWRMLIAAERLQSSDLSISQLASLVGYQTESAFGRAFRRKWGCSPREHRRQPSRIPH